MANIEKRVSKNGEISYRVYVRLKGFPRQSATFVRLTDAKKWEQATEAAIREGRHFKTSAAKKHTLSQLIERYQNNVIPKHFRKAGDQQMRISQLNWWKKELGSYSLADITPSLIAEKRDLLLHTV